MKNVLFKILLCLSLHATAQPNPDHIHEAIEHITSQFDSHNIVAIGETHDKVEVTDFYIELLGNKEFRKKVNVIVLEMGNQLFQPVLDDYIDGKEVEKETLYKLWRDHTSCMLNGSDNTGMIRLLEAIRSQNLVSDHKIRAIAADPDIDWNKVNCLEEFYKYLGSRDEYYTDIVRKYILNDSKKGLIIMGNSHFNKQRTASMKERNLQNPITALKKESSTELYLLNILSSSSFPNEKLKEVLKRTVITTKDPWLGNLKVGSPFIKDAKLAEQTDGIIYLGMKNDLSTEEVAPFNDVDYEKELERRNGLERCKD